MWLSTAGLGCVVRPVRPYLTTWLFHNLRLLPTFVGVLWEKIHMRTSFTKTLANYTSQESLITAVYNKKYHLRDFSFLYLSLFLECFGKIWQKSVKFIKPYKCGCIPPKIKCKILAHTGLQITCTMAGDYRASWNHKPMGQWYLLGLMMMD